MKNVVVTDLRDPNPQVLCIGSHAGIIQSIMDFDYATGKEHPTIAVIIATGRKSERYFFGDREIIVPVKPSLEHVPKVMRQGIKYLVNLSSGRRVLTTIQEAIHLLPKLVAGNIFAEGVPERHALELSRLADQHGILLAGGASVGIMVPGFLKLGAIGGTQLIQIEKSQLLRTDGQTAVISTSGGMVNEIIRTVARSQYGLSFAVALGGERFPILSPEQAFLLAESDPQTKSIAYFGELGGDDEYRIAELIRTKKVTKKTIAYVAGSVAELFAQPPQFGHAKAMAQHQSETATAKTAALAQVGVKATTTYTDFVRAINNQPNLRKHKYDLSPAPTLKARRIKPFASSISSDQDGTVQVLGRELLEFAGKHSFAYLVAAMFLGKSKVSPQLEAFVDLVIRLLIDHGPYVSGVVNTMVTARAGKDLASSLASGLLTIGPRFGGAINGAAGIWLEGIESGQSAAGLIENYARRRQYLPGIGHKKYSVDHPDPRVKALLKHAVRDGKFINFALAVQQETTAKKGNLILNVDGAIAAILLDILEQHEDYSSAALHELVDQEFFNGLFVLSRSVGLMAHYFDQRRLDEGLFRLNPDDVLQIDQT